MARSSSSFTICSSGTVLFRSMCDCGHPLVEYTAGPATKNPGRRFLRCRNWKLASSCKFFMWSDEAFAGNKHGGGNDNFNAIVEDDVTSDKSESIISGLRLELEDGKRKMKKMKKKLQDEMQKKLVAYVIAAASWVVCVGIVVGFVGLRG